MSCLSKSQYYIQLEDDVIAKSGFLEFIMDKINAQIDDWFLLEFSNLGSSHLLVLFKISWIKKMTKAKKSLGASM